MGPQAVRTGLLLLLGPLLSVVHGRTAYDGLSLPEDAERETAVVRPHWNYTDLSDDEDLLADEASGDGLGSGDLGSGDFQMVYFRAMVNFTRSIDYSPHLEDAGSQEFRDVSEAVVDTLESEYLKIPGEQVVSVVFIKEVEGWVFVELDVGSEGNSDANQIQEVLYSVVSSGSIASYLTSTAGFQFRRLGTETPPPPVAMASPVTPASRLCTDKEFACRTHNECIALEYRCDRRPDCRDMSDELDCEETVPPEPTVPPPRTPAPTTQQVPWTVAPQSLLPPGLPRLCGHHEASCTSGQCIPKNYFCDGQMDCADGSDEENCGDSSLPCEPNEFQCRDGRCALKLWRCDGDFDCEDHTDEENCPPKLPGDVCAPTEFRCVSTNTCIPSSFHCDEESDCPDRSDEFGCMPPQVVTPPQESVQVSRGQTVTFTCVAIGVPTPIINWRLNWGHIPSHPRVKVTSEGGRGTLTIQDVKEADQGAYTCEAMNARGMVFGIPDGVLELIPQRGPCPDGHFYQEDSSSCLPCFCFGITSLCQGSSRYRDVIRLQFDRPNDFKGVNVTMPAQPGMPPLSSTQLQVDLESQEFQLVDLSRRFLILDSFWALPQQFLGNKVDSYGGFLRYKIRYEVSRGFLEPVQKPDVVLLGGGHRLSSRGHTPTHPGHLNQRQVQFTEEHWVHDSGRQVSRAELLQTLRNLEAVLLQTVYNNKMASVGLSDVAMDTTSASPTPHGRVHSVEECRCPIGYSGLSCESCDAHFTRVPNGPYLGTCSGCNCHGHASSCDPVYGHCLNCQHNTEGPQCNKCKPGFFGDATRGTPTACRPCPCPYIDASRRFSDTCFLDTDGQATCDACAPGYTGRRCESCAPGYEGNPIQPNGKCKPITNQAIVRCDERGSTGTSGESCRCKPNVVGRLCNECSDGTFHLSASNPDGCLKCFCMGVSRYCTSSSWNRDQVHGASGAGDHSQFSLSNAAGTHSTSEGISSPAPGELVFSSFHSLLPSPYFWNLPSRFQGDKVTSYGGELHFTVTQRPSPGSPALHGQPLVLLQGNEISLEHHPQQEPVPGQPSTFSVPFREHAWRRADGQPATREHLLMALADIDVIMIRASYAESQVESRLSGLHMDVAVPQVTGLEQAVEVEQCVCPPGYRGPSCQFCDIGYTRASSGLYLGTCELCSCHGHSVICDPETGACQGCQHHTDGAKCERCQPGYYGDAQRGSPEDCQPCPCHGMPSNNQGIHTCFLDTDGHPTCDACSPGHSGRHCERCAPGYHGNPSLGQPCLSDRPGPVPDGCGCDPAGSLSTQCDKASGQCRCKSKVEGPTCSSCRLHHFYLSAANPEGCLPCFCMGVTQQCASSSYTRHLTSTPFAPGDFQGFTLVNRQRSSRVAGGFIVEPMPEGSQLSFSNFAHLGHESFYWQLPETYQGDKREAYFARLRRAHQNRTSFSEEQLREAVAAGKILGPPVGSGRASRSSQVDEAQRRMDAEIWKLLSSFAAPPSPLHHAQGTFHGPGHAGSTHPQPAASLKAVPSPPPSFSSSSSPAASLSSSANSGSGTSARPTDSQFSLAYKAFSQLPESVYYWELPRAFLGDKVDAYGGKLRYILSYTTGAQGSPLSDPDVQITGNDITLVATQPELQGRERKSFEIMFREHFWRRLDGQPATREHLMMVLADLDEILIRATFSSVPLAASIGAVSMERALPGPAAGPRALEVEECRCPPGYRGLSCQDCASGYTRTGSGLYLGHCELCECNGHSDTCHPETGACSQCLHHTTGEFCELCAPGYYGDATAGTPEDCQPCACPLTNPENMFSRTCESLGSGGYRCTACEPGYMGQYCEQCAPGYIGNPSVRGGRCQPQTDQALLVVQVHPARSTVPQGGSHSLRCQVSGSPPYYYYWTREDGRSIPSTTQQRQQGSELHFPSIQPSDAGVYICTCRNLYHANTSRAEILVTEAPTKAITVTVEEQTSQSVRAGANVTFICTAKSKSPAYTLVWTRLHNGKLPSRAMDFNGILTIRDVQPNDAGTYVCTGSNMFAMDQGSAMLHVQASGSLSPPVVSIHPPQLTVQPGQLAEFRCSATGNPAPSLEWSGGPGGQIPRKAWIHGGILRLPATEPSDQAQYICRASNSAGQHVARAVLHVHGGWMPDVHPRPEQTQVQEGHIVRLNCQVTGNPPHRIIWTKEGGSLPPKARVEHTMLFIPDATAADAGIYVCSSNTLTGSAQARMEVVIVPDSGLIPAMRIESSSPSVTEGQTVDLNCVVTGHAHAQVTWYRRGGSLPTQHQAHGTRLRLHQLTPADAGTYVCRFNGPSGHQEAFIDISVSHAASPDSGHSPGPDASFPMRIEASSTEITEGQTVDLNCVVPGQAHAQVTWYKRGSSLPVRRQDHGTWLRLYQVTPADSGEYVCRVVRGSRPHEASLVITVQPSRSSDGSIPAPATPAPVRIESSSPTVVEGQTVDLSCVVAGQAHAQVTWYKRGGSLPARHQVRGSRLYIFQATPADAGEYVCRAANGMEASLTVTVTGSQGASFSYPPGVTPPIKIESSSSTIEEGQTLVLNCVVAGQAHAQVSWYKRGGSLPARHQVHGSQLRLHQVSPADSGEYVCRVVSGSSHQEASVLVTIKPEGSLHGSVQTQDITPPIKIESSSSSVAEGQTLDLNCIITGQAHAQVTWYKRGGTLPARHQVHGSRLRLYQVSPADSGEYVCRVVGSSSPQEASVLVTIEAEGSNPAQGITPPIRIESSSSSVAEGQTLDLNCIVAGQAHAQVSWYKRGGSLPAKHQVHGSRLQLYQVSPADSGEYVCRVVGSSSHQEASVLVTIEAQGSSHGSVPGLGVTPPVRIESSSSSIMEGQTFELNCLISGQAHAQVTWYKRGGSLPARHQVHGTRLRLSQVSPADSGEYVCRVIGSSSPQEASVLITIQQQRPGHHFHPQGVVYPVRIESSSSSLANGQTLDLNCLVASHAPHTITWYKRGGTLPARHRIVGSRLRIPQVTPADSGEYVCHVSNGAGSQESSLIVTIQGGGSSHSSGITPPIRIESSSPVVTEGQTLDLNCVVPEHSQATVTWYKRGGSLPARHQVHGSRLRLNQVTSSDSGEYVCRANNNIEAQETSIVISILSNNPSNPSSPGATSPIRIESSSSSVAEGQTLDLNCLVSGQAHAQVKWYKRGGSLPAQHQVHGSQLKLFQVSPADSGEYVCRVISGSGVQEASVLVTIEAAHPNSGSVPAPGIIPPIRIESSSSSVAEGQTVDLNCVVTGQAHAQVSWYRRGGSLPARHQVHGSRLRLNQASPADSGEYVCRVLGGPSPQETSILVTIKALGSGTGPVPAVPTAATFIPIRIESSTPSVTEGHTVDLNCVVAGQPRAQVTWYKRGGTLPARHQVHGSILRLYQVSPTDAGEYVCRVIGGSGPPQEASFSIAVLPSTAESYRLQSPVISINPPSATVQQGQDATFKCLIHDGAAPISIEWKMARNQELEDNVHLSPNGSIITIMGARPSNHGTYRCVASNPYGVAHSVVSLSVQGPPTVSVLPKGPVQVKLGKAISLECVSAGEPRPSARWMRIGTPLKVDHHRTLGPMDSHAVLQITEAQPEDAGTYVCLAQNALGSAQARVEVSVETGTTALGTPEVRVEEAEMTVEAGKTAILRCSATGSPTPTVHWSKLRAPLPWKHQLSGNTLILPEVAQQDSGQYICNATNSAGHAEATVIVHVESHPYATTIPEEALVGVGEMVQFQCLAHGTPPLTFHWSRVNGSLPRQAAVRGDLLRIHPTALEDAGQYQCLVTNKVGSAQAFAHLRIQGAHPPVLAPAVHITPQQETRGIGGSVEFHCAVPSDAGAQIRWFKEGGQLPQDHTVQDGVLRIQNLDQSCQGTYICRAHGPWGQAQASAQLVVQALPSVLINIRTSVQTVVVGHAVEFECLALGDPKPHVTWSKVGGHLRSGIVQNEGTIKIARVEQADAGQYRCTATNAAGTTQSHVLLLVQALPQISAPPEVRVPAGSAAVFPCMASGFPMPDITWTKLEGDLPPDSLLENNVLTLPSVRPQDAGTYICTATNRQGKVKAFARLQVPERVVPYFTQTPHSFLPLPTIKDAYRKFEIRINFRPDAADALLLYSGMLIYNGQKQIPGPGSPVNLAARQPDFISFGLVGGRPEFRFDAGSGMATIRHPTPLALGQFHTVTLLRNLTQGSLIVGNLSPVNGTSQGKFQGLDLNEELYLGGYPDYGAIPKAGLSSGFVGCVRELRIQGEEVIFQDLNLTAHGISHCPTCKDRPCQNGGLCRDSESSSYMCTCPAGFTGSRCEHSQALHCHPEACGPDATCVNRPDGRGYSCRCHLGRFGEKCMEGVTVTTPALSGAGSYLALPALTNTHHELRLDLEFKPLAPEGLLLFSGGKGAPVEDFVSLAMTGGHLEFRYELGSGTAVLRSTQPLTLGRWHHVSAERLNKDGSLRVDGRHPVQRSSPGKSQGLNLHTLLYLGGVEPSVALPPSANVSAHFHGCIGEVSVNGKRVDLTYSFLGSRGVGQCYDSSPCERQPCQNGATCMPGGEYDFQCLCRAGFKGDRCEHAENPCLLPEPCLHGGTCQGARCLCPPGFTGPRCQKGQGAPEADWHLEGSGGNDAPGQYGAYFHDGGFLSFPSRVFPRSHPDVPETIELEVRTHTPNGLLLWQGVEAREEGRGKDFISLGLKDGHLVFSYQLGSGEAHIISEDPINDGEWHKVTALREGKSGSIQVDGEEMVSGRSPGPNVAVNTKGSIYIGGAPDAGTLTGGRFDSGITGCIKNLVLHCASPGGPPPQPLDLQHHVQAGANTRPCPS
ncbi:basement membrane-specific heparan sulfate proteoglycan core protein isoform X2 [Monodelphis domestica]|uniref:basement membrane-specific heparan sulfate proteoglycan core protein isoform X2 n=1 Tax=Monodelphis domestica TaxID=13616 RepID=UPI0024E25848|nr:basement membrane-specific heparan sulfate proteoglycan core protein isoform X2 [Monodelphis domestica]